MQAAVGLGKLLAETSEATRALDVDPARQGQRMDQAQIDPDGLWLHDAPCPLDHLILHAKGHKVLVCPSRDRGVDDASLGNQGFAQLNPADGGQIDLGDPSAIIACPFAVAQAVSWQAKGKLGPALFLGLGILRLGSSIEEVFKRRGEVADGLSRDIFWHFGHPGELLFFDAVQGVA